MWALGRFSVGASIKWSVNNRGPAAPVDPCKALNPWSGTWAEENRLTHLLHRREVMWFYLPWRSLWQIARDVLASLLNKSQWCTKTTWQSAFPRCSAWDGYWISNRLYRFFLFPLQKRLKIIKNQVENRFSHRGRTNNQLKLSFIERTKMMLWYHFVETFLQSQKLLFDALTPSVGYVKFHVFFLVIFGHLGINKWK